MKEREMRARIERLMGPAAVGITLALASCGGTDVAIYEALLPPDGQPDAGGASGTGGGTNGNGGSTNGTGGSTNGTGGATAGGAGAGGAVALYTAPMPDAASETGAAVKYMAQMPDAAATETGPAVRYMAQMPDSG